jgi:hypothetical protein
VKHEGPVWILVIGVPRSAGVLAAGSQNYAVGAQWTVDRAPHRSLAAYEFEQGGSRVAASNRERDNLIDDGHSANG